jgi:2-succinyl-6-hydroxy-2,4-cyclohexadiene-1-carboxylate synthase
MPESPRVVFLPGFMQHADSWSEVAAAVGERYPSSVVEFETWTFEERLQEIEAAGEGAVLVGYSMGGRLALNAAVRNPGRYPGLVLVGSTPGIEDADDHARRRVSDDELAAWMESHTIDDIVARWERNPVFATQPGWLLAEQRRWRLRNSPRDLAGLLRSAGQGAVPALWGRLGELSMPVLALAGAHDTDYVGIGERVAELVPLGRFELVADAGHAAHLEQPAAVRDAILAFIERLTDL